MKKLNFYILLIAVLITAPFVSKAQSVVDIVVNSPNHTILETALIEANLVDDLEGSGSFTVFAPTDAAFNALPAGTIEALLADSRGALTEILLYHLVNGKVLSTALTSGMQVATYNDDDRELLVTINDAGVFINNAKVTVADIEADNGVVHVIDAVLIPAPDIQVKNSSAFGEILTDGFGRSLYFFSKDASGESFCVDGCLNNWPVFYESNPEIPEGLNPADFASIDRGNGVMQTTFKGWPLYYYAKDSVPGQILGDAVIGKWFVAKPDYTIMITDNQLTGLNGINYKGDYTPGDELIQYFTDDKGLTLYTWKKDFYNINKFTKPDFANNGVWPIYEESEIVIPSVLNESDFSMIDVHGKNQLTYKGWPLYYFGQDMFVRGNNKGVSVPAPGIWPVPVNNMMMAPNNTTVVDIVVNSENHNTLEAAVVAAGLVETLKGEGPFTVFAPTDAAFAALPAGTVEALLADIPALTDILTYHVIGTKALSSSLNNGQKILTVQGQAVTVTINNDGVFINNAKVTVADLEADNGVVHVIDAVLLPSAIPATVVDIVVNSENHNTLEAAVVAAGLVETLKGEGPFTVFAPTDAAFAALPAGTVEALLADIPALTDILTYHVIGTKALSSSLNNEQKIVTVQGKEVTVTINENGVFINNAKVTVADIEAENGVVHVIDAVLLPPTLPATVVDILVNSENHNTLEAAVVAAGLVGTLQGAGPFTVFAPTDAAFAALPAGTVEALLADIPALTNILTYHVVGAKAMSSSLTNGQKIVTVQGKEVTVTINENGVFINNAKVTVADIEAENGVVHVIDAVLLPPTLPATVVDILVNSENHNTLEAAVVAAGLVGTLQGAGPFTVFAPTDAAFAALPAGTVEALLADIPALTNILTYHVVGAKAMSSSLSNEQKIVTVQGKEVMVTINENGVFINNAKVTVADLEADNGVVHVIDAVLLPSAIPATVVDIVVNSENHNTLEAAVVAAGLVETLQGAGPFTVFAPTDAAFAALPAGTVEALLADIPALTDILTYHVVGAKAMSSSLSNEQKIVTVQGKEVTVTINENGVFINNAKVTVADIEAENGVVHVIDAVLLPPTMPATVVDIVVNSENHNTLEAAVVAAGLVETLQGEGPFTVFAPTDAAFAALPAGTVEALLADIPALTDILTYHVVGSKAMSSSLTNGQKIVTVQGKEVMVTINENGVFINNAKVTVADIEAENGVVHVIDAVLLPPVDAAFPIDFETETDAVWAVFANGTGTEDNFMVIANPDKTGINTSDNVLKFKVNEGADPWAGAYSDSYAPVEFTENSYKVTMMVWKSVISPVGFKVEGSTNGGPVTEVKVSNTLTNQWEKITFDLSALIGYSYNRIVIFPDFPASRTSGTTVYLDNIEIENSMPATVVDIVVNSENHNTLEAAVVAAGLVGTLQGAGPFTVFAPTDAAFAALPAGTVEALLADIPALTNILTYHVVGAKAMSSSLTNGQKIVTVQGKEVTVTINENGVFINNAKVTVADIEAENGVVHIIDAVLLPPTMPATVVDIVVNSENHNTLEAAVVAAGLVETLQGAGPFTVFAPTDAAFAALPAGTVEALLADIPALTNILTYHVVGAKAMSSSLSNGQMIVTVQGKEVTVTINENGVFINNAKVTVADIEAENGVVHVIDAVLIPTTTAISTLDEISFDIYPNPASDYIRINSNNAVESLIIRDIAGRVVTQKNNLSSSERIELTGFKSGMYLVTMKNGNSVSTKKLIVK
ncbi:MAG: fasciclin domain-containing protein [Draconibacterium sp.]